MNHKSIAFHHFGCKVNFSEASTLSRQFQEKGYAIKNFHDEADIYVISTCVVTMVAEKKCRAAIRQAHKLNPGAKIAVIGCFSELKPGEIAQMEGVDLVLGHTRKFSLLEEIARLEEPGIEDTHDYHGGIAPAAGAKQNTFIPSFSFGDRTRSFLKIQDGCDYYCTYCTIPLARGKSRSDTIENVLKNATEICAHGVMEIVLTGVNIGDFGRQNRESFLQLIQALENLDGLHRVRISSIEPDLLTDEIISFVGRSKRFLPHFHIPLQSGSNRILKAMHRKYDRELFASRVTKIRELMPYACIAADIITGFPGETDEDFNDTIDFLKKLDISYLHVFTYSRRENTLAANMESPVSGKVKKVRSDILHQLSEQKKENFYITNKGAETTVLFESDNSDGFMHGFTENYIKVKTSFKKEFVNKIVPVKLENRSAEGSYILMNNKAIDEY